MLPKSLALVNPRAMMLKDNIEAPNPMSNVDHDYRMIVKNSSKKMKPIFDHFGNEINLLDMLGLHLPIKPPSLEELDKLIYEAQRKPLPTFKKMMQMSQDQTCL